ncbi:11070_t:CDS:2 [Dentiscutata heterogama]|uniref:11070_t:CDS:1 n=1 Tax=Dentiscutata heterogama TaxID=1316150 RepID=A0ACA9KR03_9GLOM|nr:11070_t:CDS:2 [Dentiscutata heterogama]
MSTPSLTGSKRGALIVFEGCDRAGKSTQTEKLVKYLNEHGLTAVKGKFPARGIEPLGPIINNYLNNEVELCDRAFHFLLSANLWEQESYLKNTILNGKTLVMDRYAYTGVAYLTAKGLDLNWCKSSYVGLPSPDIVFFMDVPLKETEKRDGFGSERFDTSEIQEKARDVYLSLKGPEWKVLDGRQSIDELHEKIANMSLEVIQKRDVLPIQDLWKSF